MRDSGYVSPSLDISIYPCMWLRFQELLAELVRDGHIKARTKWKDVYRLFKEDERYLDILGNPGSNPLELFWDVVDRLDRELDAQIAVVAQAVGRCVDKRHAGAPGADEGEGESVDKEAKEFVTPETTEDEFRKIVAEATALAEAEAGQAAQAEPEDEGGGGGVEALQALSKDDLHIIFVTVSCSFTLKLRVCLLLIIARVRVVARTGPQTTGGREAPRGEEAAASAG